MSLPLHRWAPVLVLAVFFLAPGNGEAWANDYAVEPTGGVKAGFQEGTADYVPTRVAVQDYLCFVSDLSKGAVGIPGCPGSLVFIAPLVALGIALSMGLRHPGGLVWLAVAAMSGTSFVALSNPVGIFVVVLAGFSAGSVVWMTTR